MSSRPAPERQPPHRAGCVAVVGRPNVGKSTLLNRLVGQKVSIVSRRPQTTRLPVTGIVTRADAQIVFVDTPGYQTEHRSRLNRIMNRTVLSALSEVHAVLWIVEALRCDARDEVVCALLPRGTPVVLAINKIDRLRERRLLLPFIEELSRLRPFEAIVPVSAARGTQTGDLVTALAGLLPPGPPLFDADEITTVSERALAAELFREKLFNRLGEELPYSIAVAIDRFTLERGVRRVSASVLVTREGHKGIVIGRGGEDLKAAATQARRDMERLFGGKVFLEAHVRVRKDWPEDAATLARLGYAS
ncbi:MAG: GTPase Era [Burkholderiales bacterium]|nr:GTPase Era [Burkholderiales bacterium]